MTEPQLSRADIERMISQVAKWVVENDALITDEALANTLSEELKAARKRVGILESELHAVIVRRLKLGGFPILAQHIEEAVEDDTDQTTKLLGNG